MAEQNILAGDVNVLDQMINDLNVHKETIERQGRLAESIGILQGIQKKHSRLYRMKLTAESKIVRMQSAQALTRQSQVTGKS